MKINNRNKVVRKLGNSPQIKLLCTRNMKNICYFSIPLSLLCLVCFTASGEYESSKVIGFPFIWMMDGANTLSQTIALIPLALNYLIYFASCSLVIYRFVPILQKKKVLRVGIPLVSLLLTAPFFLILAAFDTQFVLIFDTWWGYDIILKNYHFTFYGMVE